MCHAITISKFPNKQIYPGKNTIIPVIKEDGGELEAYWKGKVANPVMVLKPRLVKSPHT